MSYPTFNTTMHSYKDFVSNWKNETILKKFDLDYWKNMNVESITTNTPQMTISNDWIKYGTIFPQIKEIKILNPNKVVGFTFSNGKKIKTICDDNDVFDLKYACFLAYAKLMYSEDYTFEGVLHRAKEISYQKKFVRLVNEGLKRYKEAEKEKEKQERLKKEKKERNINKQKKKKICAAKRKEKQLNEIIDIVKVVKEEINK